ncbi:MAG: hypothetical protein QOD99_1767 [Chthoniobacter sp.]|nr:hypothetical protein [Chthoniobacter sp.]
MSIARLTKILLCWLLVGAAILRAQVVAPLPEAHDIADAGQRRTFEVATDEVHSTTPARGRLPRRVSRTASPQAVRAEAARLSRATGEETELVLYEKDLPHNEWTRRLLTKEIAVRVKEGADPKKIADSQGLIFEGEAPGGARGFYIFRAKETGGALTAAESLRTHPDVELAEPQLARQQHKRFTPNDTYFTNQWHLKNTGQGSGTPGMDANLTTVWDTYKGDGVRIGIVDDGLQTAHPDLAANVDTMNDHDWNDATPDDPNPVVTVDFHGTSCAGVAAARGNNSLGVSGAAPDATLVGLRLIGAATTDTQEAEAMSYKNDIISIKSNSWGPNDDGLTLEGPGPLTQAALAQAAQTGRGGLGTIILWAGGNGGNVGDNSNYDGYANSIYTIAIAALTNQGEQAYYSEPGANLVVASPSNGGTLSITTTDLVGNNGYNTSSTSGELSNRDYTQTFGGTSSATPLAAGCVALILQANPNLGWRDVQEVLIASATKISGTDSDWVTNGGGYHFNHKFGAGLVNTGSAVALAHTWTNLPPQAVVSSTQSGLSVAIPDSNSTGITRSFNLANSALRVEQVTVTTNINHTSRGQLAITLTSPGGTVSRLAEKHSDTGDNYANWTFSSVRDWGESSNGTWTVRVADLTAGTVGTLTSMTLTVYGALGNQLPIVTGGQLSMSGTAFSDQTVSVQGVTTSDAENDPVTVADQWQQTADNSTFSDIAGATGTSLNLTAFSGQFVRCKITPSDPTHPGSPYFTGALAINNRPNQLAQNGQSYSYDSDLYVANSAMTFTRPAIINEFSQGPSGAKEWIEILFLQTVNATGWKLGDANTGTLFFSSSALWSSVPAGTLLVVYNGADRDTNLPTDNATAGSPAIISSTNKTYFSSGSWGGLSNSGAESIILNDSAGTLIDGLSFNGASTNAPVFGTVGANTSEHFNGNAEAAAEMLANWSSATDAAATPAAGNGSVNSQFVSDLRNGIFSTPPKFRFGASGDAVPGLSIDANTGVISGPVNVPAGGTFNLVIERYNATSVATQTFALLVPDANGNYNIGNGKIWMLDNDYTLTGNLIVNGTLDTDGHMVTVSGKIDVMAGSSVGNSSGVIAYLSRDGADLPGVTHLLGDAAHDAADDDGDGVSNLNEFGLGMNPSVASMQGLSAIATQSVGGENRLALTYNVPVGATGVNRIVEVSDNLATWSSGAGATEVTSDTTTNGIRTVTVRDLAGTASSSHRFIRFRATR